MKKGLLVIFLMLLLSGCGEEKEALVDEPKQETMVCELSSRDVVSGYEIASDYTIYYTGDYVDKVETVETVTSESEEFLDSMEESINSIYEATNNAYGGYTYEVIKEDGKVVSNVTIDYSKMDLEQYVSDQPSLAKYVEDGNFLVEGIVDIYESNGATCE